VSGGASVDDAWPFTVKFVTILPPPSLDRLFRLKNYFRNIDAAGER
jgi:hypothetical protein